MPRLYAISDLHVGHDENLRLVATLGGGAEDWLVLGGDLGETPAHLEHVLELVVPRFAQIVWVPGNHELWTFRAGDPRGEAKYDQLVAICRARGVLTPEDPYPIWDPIGDDSDRRLAIVPMFLLYDYSFRPAAIAHRDVVAWAAEENSVCADEELLWPDPHPSREAWCAVRVAATERRLAALPDDVDTILINHFPLRQRHAILPRIPRFTPWCGTRKTDDWHLRFRARAVIYGHLHIPRTFVEDGVAFEEVSLGYPSQRRFRGFPGLRQVWPRPPHAADAKR
ncbi:MAG TPA: metallophosphoesterase [Kofleriaceae bacterium]|nr:metallophosphoesterase [Kofleriaceae bacterium]